MQTGFVPSSPAGPKAGIAVAEVSPFLVQHHQTSAPDIS
jgi:hypothetical protein